MQALYKLLVASFLLASCAMVESTSSGRFGPDTASRSSNPAVESGPDGQTSFRPGAIFRGTDELTNRSALGDTRRSRAVIQVVDDELVQITLINASVASAAEAVLGETLKLHYSVSPEVTGTVTVQSTGPVPKAVLLNLFQASLESIGARLEERDGIVTVIPTSSGSRSFRNTNSKNLDGSSIIVAPLKFISVKQVVGVLSPLVDGGLRVTPDENRNLLLMSGSQAQLEAAVEALNIFDVDVLQGKSVALVQLEAADPEDVVRELQVIFQAEVGELLEGVIEFIPNNRLSSVLIITSRAQYLDRAQKWVRDLDVTASRSRRYTKVYSLQNREAVDIAPILDEFLSGGKPASSENEGGTSSLQTAGATSRVAADISRNALVVRALRVEHEEVRRLLVELDNRGRQVALEATIAEVRLNDDFEFGVRWFFETNSSAIRFTDANSGAVAPKFPGFSAAFPVGNVDVVINALAGVTDVKIISSPTLVVMDNKEALLKIGDQVPIATQSSTSNSSGDAPTVTNIEYRDTGVILKVKPQIGSSGNLVLNIDQEVSSVASSVSSGINSPTISQRQISTSVVLRDGATLALAGLIQETDTKTTTKVPVLGDAPIVGNLFKDKSSEKNRTELLLLIRPHIIENDDDAAGITSAWRSRLSKSASILNTGLGEPRHTLRDILE
ncbi:type II secretion system secretin GspD [Ruegeria pomeroyi]|uniref:type II secretion system secretin GspD n=1 Tax=Ruegeria pomeroyi TaxID=89184 RepID=UPI001F4902E6|nr:type II secretion system secretin GspD [Ruegeria pomeroyi]MCE8510915.1 type II secretion system secretin GspD [Ruegeria pomeroyi]